MKSLLSKLNVETFILDTTPIDTGRLTLDGFDYRFMDDRCLEVDVKKEDSLNKVFALLDEQQIKVLSMRNKANRLKELFVRLVEGKQ